MKNIMIALVLVAFSPVLSAQEIVFKDGKSVKWTSITIVGEDQFSVEVPIIGRMLVNRDAIARITHTNEEKASPLTGATITFKEKTETVNLFTKMDPKKDAFCGVWKFSTKGLVNDPLPEARVMIGEYEPPAEYDLDVVVEPVSGNAIGVYLVGGGRQFLVQIGKLTGVWCIDGLPGENQKGNDVKLGDSPLAEKKATRITYMVRKDGFVVQIDGKDFYTWKGDWSRLSVHANHSIPRTKVLGFKSGEAVINIRQAALKFAK